MSEDVIIQFKADRRLQEDCSAIYGRLGIDLSTAFRIFMERTKEVKGFPFSAPARKRTHEESLLAFEELREQARDVLEMSLDEINSEIRAARAEKRKCKCPTML